MSDGVLAAMEGRSKFHDPSQAIYTSRVSGRSAGNGSCSSGGGQFLLGSIGGGGGSNGVSSAARGRADGSLGARLSCIVDGDRGRSLEVSVPFLTLVIG